MIFVNVKLLVSIRALSRPAKRPDGLPGSIQLLFEEILMHQADLNQDDGSTPTSSMANRETNRDLALGQPVDLLSAARDHFAQEAERRAEDALRYRRSMIAKAAYQRRISGVRVEEPSKTTNS